MQKTRRKAKENYLEKEIPKTFDRFCEESNTTDEYIIAIDT